MTKSKKSIVMHGALLRPLVIGQGALLHAGGKIYHTSRVVGGFHHSLQNHIYNLYSFNLLFYPNSSFIIPVSG